MFKHFHQTLPTTSPFFRNLVHQHHSQQSYQTCKHYKLHTESIRQIQENHNSWFGVETLFDKVWVEALILRFYFRCEQSNTGDEQKYLRPDREDGRILTVRIEPSELVDIPADKYSAYAMDS